MNILPLWLLSVVVLLGKCFSTLILQWLSAFIGLAYSIFELPGMFCPGIDVGQRRERGALR